MLLLCHSLNLLYTATWHIRSASPNAHSRYTWQQLGWFLLFACCYFALAVPLLQYVVHGDMAHQQCLTKRRQQVCTATAWLVFLCCLLLTCCNLAALWICCTRRHGTAAVHNQTPRAGTQLFTLGKYHLIWTSSCLRWQLRVTFGYGLSVSRRGRMRGAKTSDEKWESLDRPNKSVKDASEHTRMGLPSSQANEDAHFDITWTSFNADTHRSIRNYSSAARATNVIKEQCSSLLFRIATALRLNEQPLAGNIMLVDDISL